MKSKMIVLIAIFLTACVYTKSNFSVSYNLGLKSVTDKKLVKRFEEYWKMRALKDVNKAFVLENPYFRYVTKFSVYENYVKLNYKKKALGAVLVNDFSCEKDYLCCFEMDDVYVDGEYSASRRDCWVEVSGDWYHIVDNPMFFK